jgi:hypothetical protein
MVKPGRPRDLNPLTKLIVGLSTGDAAEKDPNEGKDPAAVKGPRAHAISLTPILGPALIALSIAIVLAIFAAAVYFAFMAPEIFFTLLAIGAVFFGFAYWEATREAKRAAARQADAKLSGLANDEPQS